MFFPSLYNNTVESPKKGLIKSRPFVGGYPFLRGSLIYQVEIWTFFTPISTLGVTMHALVLDEKHEPNAADRRTVAAYKDIIVMGHACTVQLGL